MKTFCKRLKESLMDEHKAPRDYAKLSASIPSKSIKRSIKHISNQERKHFRTLHKIKNKEC